MTDATTTYVDRGEACARLGLHCARRAAEAVARLPRHSRRAYLAEARKIAETSTSALGAVTTAEVQLCLEAFDRTIEACMQSKRDNIPVDFKIAETGEFAGSFEPRAG